MGIGMGSGGVVGVGGAALGVRWARARQRARVTGLMARSKQVADGGVSEEQKKARAAHRARVAARPKAPARERVTPPPNTQVRSWLSPRSCFVSRVPRLRCSYRPGAAIEVMCVCVGIGDRSKTCVQLNAGNTGASLCDWVCLARSLLASDASPLGVLDSWASWSGRGRV